MFRRVVAALFAIAMFAPMAEAERPHIVLIMCDDMGFSDIGCYGGEIATPHIDRLAEEGLRFRQFYNNAKCTTTRASLITGLYPRRKGRLLQDNMQTIPEALASAGYRSVLSGKWHLGSSAPTRPSDRGFDSYYGLLDGCCNFFDPSIQDPPFKGNRIRWFGENDRRITEFPDDFYTTDAFTDYACTAINEAVADDVPLFLHVCYTAPHYPLHAPPEDIAKYRGNYRDGWNALRQRRYERQLAMGLVDEDWELPPADPEVPDWSQLSEDEQDYYHELMAVYAAMIDRMDQGIGRILARLDEHGIAENTVVFFLSDNGGCAEKPGGIDLNRVPGPKEFYTACGPGWAFAQNTPFRRYKQWVHEGGISTPLIVRWPGEVAAGEMTDSVGHIIDLLPTCVELTEAPPSDRDGQDLLPVEGQSLVDVLRGEETWSDRKLYWEWSGNRAIRDGQWKLAWDKKVKTWELYDIPADRTEMHDLADRRPDLVERLADDWYAWADETGVKYSKP